VSSEDELGWAIAAVFSFIAVFFAMCAYLSHCESARARRDRPKSPYASPRLTRLSVEDARVAEMQRGALE
jgi:hypothetical protein